MTATTAHSPPGRSPRAPYSAQQRLKDAEAKLGKPLYTWLTHMRSDDVCPCCRHVCRKALSWRGIAKELERVTDIRVSYQGIHEWYTRREKVTDPR